MPTSSPSVKDVLVLDSADTAAGSLCPARIANSKPNASGVAAKAAQVPATAATPTTETNSPPTLTPVASVAMSSVVNAAPFYPHVRVGGNTTTSYFAGSRIYNQKNAQYDPCVAARAPPVHVVLDTERAQGVPVPSGLELVDTVDRCREVCADLLERSALEARQGRELVVAVDLEGVDLSREGRVSVVTLATHAVVYLFDITTMGQEAFEKKGGQLRSVLTSPGIRKLMYDCRCDVDALYFLHRVLPVNVRDLQPMIVEEFHPTGQYLIGLQKGFGMLNLFTSGDSWIKGVGPTLYDPTKGGTYEVWERRPLQGELVEYCAVDVKYFFKAEALLNARVALGDRVALMRCQTVVSAPSRSGYGGPARDF